MTTVEDVLAARRAELVQLRAERQRVAEAVGSANTLLDVLDRRYEQAVDEFDQLPIGTR